MIVSPLTIANIQKHEPCKIYNELIFIQIDASDETIVISYFIYFAEVHCRAHKVVNFYTKCRNTYIEVYAGVTDIVPPSAFMVNPTFYSQAEDKFTKDDIFCTE